MRNLMTAATGLDTLNVVFEDGIEHYMLCPKCKNETSVVDSRDIEDTVIRRRRECDNCNYRFTTYERTEPVNITVLKRDGAPQAYDREKIKRGILIATQKRTNSEQEIEDILDRIESKLFEIGKSEIQSRKIGELVIKELLKLDEVAYLRFASVYKSFRSAKSFKKELEKLTR